MNENYRALLAKIDAFQAQASQRRAADLACKAGCDGCCQVHLEVSAVEAESLAEALGALDAEAATAMEERALAADPATPRCPMLNDTGRCEVYEARPLVCRTQGLALRYPAGVIPRESVLARAGDAEITWCPLNFTQAGPEGEDVLDAERVDQMLAIINHQQAEQAGTDASERTPLLTLARLAPVLASGGDDHV